MLERVSVPEPELGPVLARLTANPVIREVMVLSTCNRTEVYLAVDGATSHVVHAVDHFFAERSGLSIADIAGVLRLRHDAEAVTHLCAVACGLDSMATGEEHIVAQLRTALQVARDAGTLGGTLSSAVDAALRASKRARTETDIGSAAPSLVAAGLDLGRSALGDLAGRPALLVGTGSIGTLAARALRESGVGKLLVAGRTPANTRRLADSVDGTAVTTENLPAALARCEVLVCATGAMTPVIRADALRVARADTDRPLFCLDLAMPRDIDPACAAVHGVTLVDLDVLGDHLGGRGDSADVAAAWKIVVDEAAIFVRSRSSALTGPLIGALRSRAASLVRLETQRLWPRLPALGTRERAEIEGALNRAVRKLLHTPTVRVKELATDTDGDRYMDALARLFDLRPAPTPDEGNRA